MFDNSHEQTSSFRTVNCNTFIYFDTIKNNYFSEFKLLTWKRIDTKLTTLFFSTILSWTILL